MNPIFRNSPDAHEVVASVIIEQAMEPVKPKILKVENSPDLFYVRFEACLQDFNVFNRNNRKYLLAPMMESWEAPHIKELISRGDLFGEAGHPITKDPMRVVSIDPKVACHRIIGKEFKGTSLYGTIETLNDDLYGKQFTKHILQGCTAAFSLRALAPLTKIDAKRVEIRSKCHIVTEDRVILPSHNKAYATATKPILVKGTGTYEGYVPDLSEYGNVSEENVNIAWDMNMESSTEVDLVQYLMEESHNVKEIMDHFEVGCESAYLDAKKKNMIISEPKDEFGGKRTFVVSLESFVRNEVMDILR